MANDINLVALIGRLTRDAELKYTNSGTPVSKFSLAVNRKKRSGDHWTDEVSYFDIVLWGKQGEALQQYLIKGKQIAVSGELRQNRWEHDGHARSKVEIIASNIQLLSGNSSSGSIEKVQTDSSTNGASSFGGPPPGNAFSRAQEEQAALKFEDDDIPF
jgi:single-strand DNA-binding protein